MVLPFGIVLNYWVPAWLARHALWDKIYGRLAWSGKFEVSSFCGALGGLVSVNFPWKSIWGTKVPGKIVFFIWVVALGSILTIYCIYMGNLLIVNWCCMCISSGESIDYLSIHYLVDHLCFHYLVSYG